LSRAALEDIGIRTIFEKAKPVGTTAAVDAPDETWLFPHIFGGIAPHIEGVVTATFPMKRDQDGKFLSIEGLTDADESS